jgi:hypothetical protein
MRARKLKKHVKRKDKSNGKAESPPAEKSAVSEEDMDDAKLDFGVLPDRDLKKNLGGCG